MYRSFSKEKISSAILNGRAVPRISAYLVVGRYDGSPAALAENEDKASIGSFLRGSGFIFDDQKSEDGETLPLQLMRDLIAADKSNKERIRPYIGGSEITNHPRHEHHRFVIDFDSFPLERNAESGAWSTMSVSERKEAMRKGVVPADYPDKVARDWPMLVDVLMKTVKPDRMKKKEELAKRYWWRFFRPRPALYRRAARKHSVFAINSGASSHFSVALLPSYFTYAHTLTVITIDSFAAFAALQSRSHELWTRFFASTMKDDLRYTPSDCFETFPFPIDFGTSVECEFAGSTYHEHRSAVMVTHNQGMTNIYNRFNDRTDSAEDLRRLRDLHLEMDRAILKAYGWHDLAAQAEPIFLDETNEDDYTYQGRLFWPSDFRDEVLARLLALNAERHAEEVRLGIAPGMKGKKRGDDEDYEEGLA